MGNYNLPNTYLKFKWRNIFQNTFLLDHELREPFDQYTLVKNLIFSKTSSEGGDFPHILAMPCFFLLLTDSDTYSIENGHVIFLYNAASEQFRHWCFE